MSKATKPFGYVVATATRNQLGNCPGLCWYFLSDWALAQLDGNVGKGVATARAAMRELGAMLPRSDASPYQPSVANLATLVLSFGTEGAAWVCRRLRRMARQIAAHCEKERLRAQAWDTQYSNLSDRRCGFRVLVAGAAKIVEAGERKELRRALKQHDIAFVLRQAAPVEFVDALFASPEDESYQYFWWQCSGEDLEPTKGHGTRQEVANLRKARPFIASWLLSEGAYPESGAGAEWKISFPINVWEREDTPAPAESVTA